MPALELKTSELPPLFTFQQRHMVKRDAQGEMVYAYTQVPLLDDAGEQVTEDFPTPTGIIKRPVLVDDMEKPIMKDIMMFRPHGSRDEVEVHAAAFVAQCMRQARSAEASYPMAWAQTYETAYKNWKAGFDTALQGTDTLTWKEMPEVTRKMLVAVGFPTLELLANANEQALQQIGTGARNLKNRAADYLARVNAHAGEATRNDVKVLQDTVAAQSAQIAELLKLLTPKVDVAPVKVDAPETQPAAGVAIMATADPVGDAVKAQLTGNKTLHVKK
jgi:hypothetical protein